MPKSFIATTPEVGTGDVVGPGSAVSGNLASFSGTTGKIIADSGIAAANVLVDADVLRSYLASTVTYNNTDTLADTPLSVTVAAGGIYEIELVVQSTQAVKALLMDFAGTATIANFVGTWSGLQAISGVPTTHYTQISAAGTDFNAAALDGSDDTYYTFNGSVEIADAGTFLLRGAQNAADASNTTILRGSTLVLTKMN